MSKYGVLWVFLDENGDVEDRRVEERRSRSKKERWKGIYKYNHRRSDKGRCVFRLVERSEAWKLRNKLLELDLSEVNREWLEEKDINALYRIVKTPRRRYGNFSFREDEVERLAKDYDMFLRTDGDFGRDDLKKAYDALSELQDS